MLQESSGGSASTTAAKLKYSIFRNLAGIFKDQGDLAVSIDTYLKVSNQYIKYAWMLNNDTRDQQATLIDDTDITTWLQLSKVAQLQGNLPIARIALEKVNY